MPKQLKTRLREAREKEGSGPKLCIKMGISPAQLTKMLKGEKPKQDRVKIAINGYFAETGL